LLRRHRPCVVFDYSPPCSTAAEGPSEVQYCHRTHLDGIGPAFSGGPSYTEYSPQNREYIRRALEVSIHVGLVVLLTAACLFVLLPFRPLVAWGIIIAIAVFPAYRWLRSMVGGRGSLAATIFTLLFLAILIVPIVMLAETMVEGVQTLVAHVKDGSLSIPPPPANVGTWPIIGAPLQKLWTKASTDLTGLLQSLLPQIKDLVPGILAATAGFGPTVLQFVLSILVAGVLLANASGCAEVTRSLANACSVTGVRSSRTSPDPRSGV